MRLLLHQNQSKIKILLSEMLIINPLKTLKHFKMKEGEEVDPKAN